MVGYEYGYESGAAVYQIDLLLSGIPLRNTCIIRRIICIVDVNVPDLVPGDLVPGVFCFQFGAHDLVPRRFSAWSI